MWDRFVHLYFHLLVGMRMPKTLTFQLLILRAIVPVEANLVQKNHITLNFS